MELEVHGREFYPNMKLKIWFNPEERFDPDLGAGERYRLVLVEEGAGILRLGERRLAFNAPALFCLNELERPILERSSDLKAKSLYFHPRVINSALNFENLRQKPTTFSETESHDRHTMRAFFIRNDQSIGYFSIGLSTARKLSRLFSCVVEEFSAQRDNYWPCRTRSFFLELIFLIDRLYAAPQEPAELPLPETGDEIDGIILFLHSNYQRKVTISELTKEFNVNRTTLTEKFAAATGSSIITYLSKLRVRVASLMLRDTLLPISEVMERVGFIDQTHFGRVFKKTTGLSPSEYRDQHCWMAH